MASAIAIVACGAGSAYAQEPDPLSPARYAALDGVYTANLVFDGNPTVAQIAEVKRVCEALDPSDRLLAITRKGCLNSLKAIAPAEAFGACTTPRGCRRAARRLRIALNKALADARASNRIVAMELPPGPCRTELTASRALLRDVGKLRDALGLLERGLATGNRAVIRRAERRIVTASLALATLPTAAESRETFRRVCAPAGTPAAPASVS